MAVEIRELVLQARIVEEEPEMRHEEQGLEEVKAQILAECERMIRDAMERRQVR